MSSSDPLIGKKLGDYLIVDLLGQGGMARVYRGKDNKLNRYAAVKVIDVHLIGDEAEEYRQRFTNEARSIARLNHPNIVGIYQFDQVGTTYYMAMSFIEGRDLRTILKNHARANTRMSYAEIRRVIRDIADALDYAHSEGVIHRDVKPSNIMVMPDGKAVLTDFGLALSVPEGTIGNTFGSAHYIAPEQAVSSAQAVPQSDLYSLGIVLFEMLTNRVPFNDPSAMAVAMKHLNEPPPAPSRLNPNISSKVDEVVMRAMDKDAKKRYPTGAALVKALDFAFAIGSTEPEAGQDVQPLPSWGGDTSSRPTGISRPTPPTGSSRSTPPLSASRPTPPTGSSRSTPPMPSESESMANRRIAESWDSPSRSRPMPYMDDNPTVTDSQASASTRAEMLKYQQELLQQKQATRRLVIIFAILGIAAVIGALVLFSGVLNPATTTATPTTTAAEATPVRPTDAGIAALFGTATPDDTSVLATSTPPTEVISIVTSELTPEIIAPSETPVPTEVPPTATLTPTPAPTEVLPVALYYDPQGFTLLNQSGADVDVSNLTFVQQVDANNTLEFESRLWESGTRPTSALPAGDCFQVFPDSSAGVPDKPAVCDTRHAWSRVSPRRLFWISDDPAATFEVRRGTRVLATCDIAAEQCSFDPGR
jgi:serine/threonine protein kinase